MYNIPLFELNFGKEEEKAVVEVLQSKWISIGPKVQEFEEKFAKMLNVKYACAVSNCTDALHLACYVLGIGEGDEVICPSLTFAATVNCIKYVGATPIFCDVTSLDDFSINADLLESLITTRTKAIIPMHFAGYPCNMDKIMKIAEKNSLHVIEDACHGPLSQYKGEKLGTIGRMGCFSFFSNKNISTGEGGMIVTNDNELIKRLKTLRSHGMTTMSYERAKGHATAYDIEEIGFNFRMDDIRAAIGCVQLDKLQEDLNRRIQIRERYVSRLQNCSRLIIPYVNNVEYTSNYIFPILLNESDVIKREKVRNILQQKGIQTSVHYPAIHRFSVYYNENISLPLTEYITDNEITLPMYSKLSDEKIDYICTVLLDTLEEDF